MNVDIELYMQRNKPDELTRATFEMLVDKAYSSRDPIYRFRLGCCYLNGWITERNSKLAFKMFSEAADEGCAFALHKLGNCFYMKRAVKVQDIPKAIEYWSLAAEQGVMQSFHNIGMTYYYNMRDYEKAVEFYTKAAEQGYIESHLALASIYRSGKGIKRDIGKACEWYSKAIELGSLEAQDRLFALLYPKKSKSKKVVGNEANETESEDKQP